MQTQVKKAKAIISERNKDIQKKENKKEELLAKNTDIELKIKENSHELKKLEDNCKNAQHRVKLFYLTFYMFVYVFFTFLLSIR